ncbi:MurR/RpiR family transcriptional regulator [Paenibacillus lautus]|uniref:MurR/RpiR family transcriptional regulator n=2 Tax=Paenibacillus TaxID=44249 RepID=UPI002DBB8FC9|nr:MurR/RpiR family transcriptional regulator [Paenibacillus lautus]MEC0254762.1 MurR/RpiR family transcriptional regulator [Paenibacillus lautus]
MAVVDSMDIYMVIQQLYPSFSKKEQLVANYILQEGQSINNMNISVLANHVGVSNGTITHFCKKIGCRNFAELKVQLGRLRTATAPSAEDNILIQVSKFYQTVIERSNQLLDITYLHRLAEAIKSAARIYIYGIGSSGLSAKEMMLRLLRMGFNVQSITDSHLMLINSSIVNENDFVIAISSSGETSVIVDATRIAKNNGCKVICLTSFSESTLAQQVDSFILVSNTLFVDKERFVNSQFSVMYAIDILCMILLEDADLNSRMQITVNTILEHNRMD